MTLFMFASDQMIEYDVFCSDSMKLHLLYVRLFDKKRKKKQCEMVYFSHIHKHTRVLAFDFVTTQSKAAFAICAVVCNT